MKAVIYEKDTDKVINIIQGNITINDYEIVNEKGEGVRGYKPDKIGYTLCDDNDIGDIDLGGMNEEGIIIGKEVKINELNLSAQKHEKLAKEFIIKQEEKIYLRERAIKRLKEKGIDV